MRSLALLVTAALAATPPVLAAPVVTLNGVNIAGVANQKFENVTVVIDAQGNLDIQAKGYAARVAGSGTPGATANATPPAAPRPVDPPQVAAASSAGPRSSGPARPGRRYFLVTEQTQPDGTQYDVEVFINASWIRVIKSADPQLVTEITRYLHPGTNKVTLSCTKRLQGADRHASGADVTLKVVVGGGNIGGDHVMIDEPLATMVRTAAEIDDKVEEFVFEVH
jgi:hypothetical protein